MALIEFYFYINKIFESNIMRPYKSAKKNPQNWIETLRQYRDVT